MIMGEKNDSEYLEEVFDVLGSTERRKILLELEENNHVTGEDVLDSLEQEDPGGNLKTSLYHVHLPKLRDSGWIDYDERPNDLSDFDIILDIDEEDEKDSLVLKYLDQVFEADEEDLDIIFQSLKAPASRRTLYWLNQEEGRSNLNMIATYLAEDEAEDEDYKVSNDEIEYFRSQLKHSYLPSLDDSGILEFDHVTEKVKFTEEYAGSDNALIRLLDEVYS
jgi:DNA-binding transcriptional ArsR family regulator